jgi:hypothetical protein
MDPPTIISIVNTKTPPVTRPRFPRDNMLPTPLEGTLALDSADATVATSR